MNTTRKRLSKDIKARVQETLNYIDWVVVQRAIRQEQRELTHCIDSWLDDNGQPIKPF